MCTCQLENPSYLTDPEVQNVPQYHSPPSPPSSASPPSRLIQTGSRLQFCPILLQWSPSCLLWSWLPVKDGGGYRAAWSPAGTTGSLSRTGRFPAPRTDYSTVACGCTCGLALENHFHVHPDIRTSICKSGNTEQASGIANNSECCRKAATTANLIQVATALTTTNASASLVRKQSNNFIKKIKVSKTVHKNINQTLMIST